MNRLRRKVKTALLGFAVAATACTDSCSCGRDEPQEELEPRTIALQPGEINERLWPSDGPRHYVEDIPDRIDSLAVLIQAVARQAADGAVEPRFLAKLGKRAGFVIEYWELANRRYLAVLEAPAYRTGAGAYVFRIGPRNDAEREYLLQAPHSFYDLDTGALAVALLLAGGDEVRGLFVNTLHRYIHEDGRKGKEQVNPADVTHNPDHPFSAATEAAARVLEELEVIQIHGFDRNDVDGHPDAIVSAGDRRRSSSRSSAVALRLRNDFGIDAVRYPEDTRSLGATQNAQLARLRSVFGTSFIHVELARSVRRSTAADRDRVVELAHALLGLEPA